jgi:uncharacterized phage protein (TIGR02220 family)
MFTQKIIDSDAFLDMPLSTQALYFHLNMRADDDGFVNNPKRIQRTIGASGDDLKLLFAKRFVIGFESGVLVIKHWRMHNTLRKDRYNPTQYQDELASLEVKDNNAYTERLVELPDGVATAWQPDGNQMATQYSIGKYSIDKISIDSPGEHKEEDKPQPEIYKTIVSYLNEKAGTRYKPTSAKTKSVINGRLAEGFKLDDFMVVIDKKCAEWLGNEKMEKYLRPETLFGTKFEGYLNAKQTGRNGSNGQASRDTNPFEDICNFV